jgi:hypothetical protein
VAKGRLRICDVEYCRFDCWLVLSGYLDLLLRDEFVGVYSFVLILYYYYYYYYYF